VVAEALAVRSAVFLPALDVCDEHARAYDAGEVRPQLREGAGDDLEAAPGLRVRIAGGLDVSAVGDGGGTGDVDMRAGA
jgi:hypothetical protein